MKSGGSILVVDDETVVRNILMRIIKRQGYSVDEATDGVEALDKLSNSRYDMVVSDIKMPNMDGMTLLKEVKARYPDIIVLIITAYSDRYTPGDVIAAGADFFITKPFKNMEIAKTLEAFASRNKTVRSGAATITTGSR